MVVSLQQVAEYLDNRGWRYHLEPAKSRIVTGVESEQVESFLIVISLKEDGAYLELAAPQLLMVKDHVYKGVLFQTLLAIAWEVKLLRWEYDPSDGEVRASIAIALEDALLTERQFNRMLGALVQLVDQESMPRLKAVLATGEDPGRKGVEQALAEMLQEMLPEGGLAELQQAIAQLQQTEDE